MLATLEPSSVKQGLERPDMARKKPPTKTVRVHLDVAAMIDTCAGAERRPVPEWLSDLLRPLLKERIAKSVAALIGEDLQPRKRKQ